MLDKPKLFNLWLTKPERERLERVRQRTGTRSAAEAIRHLISEADGAAPVPEPIGADPRLAERRRKGHQ